MKTRYLLLILAILAPWLLSNCIRPGGSDEYKRLVTTSMMAGEGPDVGYVDSLQMAEYAAQGWLKPVPDQIDREGFYPATVQQLMWQGTLYAVPHDTQTIALIVNQQLLDQVGLPVPADWEQLNAVAYELTMSYDDVYGLGMTTGFWSFVPFLYQAGGQLVDGEGQLALDSEEALLALETYIQPSLGGYALVVDGQEGFEQGGTSGLLESFADEKVAMFIGGTTTYSEVLQRMRLDPATQGMVRVYELPAGPAGQATIAFTRGFGLFGRPSEESSPAVVTLLEYATSEDGLAFWLGDASTPPDYIPVRPSLAGQWVELHPDTKAFVAGLDYARNYQPDDVPSSAFAEFYEMANSVFPQALSGELPAHEVLLTIHEQGNEILQQYR